MKSNEALAAVILQWLREKYPERYKQTLAVASNPAVFRRHLVRHLEIRWADEPSAEWLVNAPLSALEETSITLNARLYGAEVVLAGNKVTGRTWGFGELNILLRLETEAERRAEFRQLASMKEALDLTLIDVTEERS